MNNIDVYIITQTQKITCSVCRGVFDNVTKMASHIKSSKQCREATGQNGLTWFSKSAKVTKMEKENLVYIHGKIRLFCALCQNNDHGRMITSMTGHFRRYCECLDETIIEQTRSEDGEYYKKQGGGKGEKEE